MGMKAGKVPQSRKNKFTKFSFLTRSTEVAQFHWQILLPLLLMPGQLAAGSLAEAVFGNPELARSVYGKSDAKRASTPVFVDPAAWEASLISDEEGAENVAPPIFAEEELAGDVLESVSVQDRNSVRKELLRAVEMDWLVGKNVGSVGGEKSAESPMERKLRTIRIPKICFWDMPFRDAVDLLGEIAEELDGDGESRGVNIALRDEPEGPCLVRMTLRDIELGRAIQLLAQCVNFDWEVDGDVVLLSSAEKNRERVRTKFFPLSRAAVLRMTNMRQTVEGEGQVAREERLLQEFFQNSGVDFCELPGTALAFDGSWLIVTQTPRNLQRVEEILLHYSKTKQVEIETKFIEVQQGVLDELQFRWHVAREGTEQIAADTEDTVRALAQAFSPQNGTTGSGAIVLEQDGQGEKRIPIPNVPPTLPNCAAIGQNSMPLIDIMGIIGGARVGFVLRALEQQTGSDLMSAPKVTVLSGKTAEIVVAQEFRY
ncbi:MAG: hypothetical protein LBC42_03970, partial [Puniceicoccales bacterium]|nr:hypothetical protein [Puniceicoccales bacterium]